MAESKIATYSFYEEMDMTERRKRINRLSMDEWKEEWDRITSVIKWRYGIK